MTDPIERQAAIDALAKWLYGVFGIKESDGTATIFKRFRELPSAQSEIIRCEECKHRHEAECPMYHEEDIEWDDDGYTECDMVIHDWTEDDGYCDRGERRTDETD